MKKSLVIVFAIVFFFVQMLHAVHPKKYEIQRIDEFLEGKFEGVSVSFNGILSLSPKEEIIEGPAEEFYLSFLLTSEGSAYLGTGHAGKIYRISKDGKIEPYFKVPEMDIYCLAQDGEGNLYAGTSPNGKIYRITGKDKGEVFFNPIEKYIWDLLFTDKGSLLAAVGESGGIYEISRQGEGVLVLKAEENHILCLKMDKNNDLIAGSGGKGRLYRISKEKKAFVLFESPYEEIKSVAFDNDGNIYAASGGTIISPEKKITTPVLTKADTNVSIIVSPTVVRPQEVLDLAKKQPSVLYKISPQGIAKKLWSSSKDLIYTLSWNDREKKLLFGTGNRGRIYSIDSSGRISLLLRKDSEQVYLLFPRNSSIYTLCNNPSKLSIIYSEQRFNGEYLSRVFDTKILSSWGRIEWDAEIPPETVLQFQTRSGNSSEPDKTWSNWSPPYRKEKGEPILSPKARYIQCKAIFKTESGNISPELRKISFFYLQTNVAPLITKLEWLPPNEVFLKPPEQKEIIWGEDVRLSEHTKSEEENVNFALVKKVRRKGFQTVQWDAVDENGDDLQYSVFIKKQTEDKWRILKEKWREKIFAFDTLSFPDGVYFMKIEAVDVPSNPLGMDLKSEKVSRAFVIDNSLPVVKAFLAVRNNNKLQVSFLAEDSFSDIEEVKFLIFSNEWRSVFPTDGICDSRQERFNILVPLPLKFDNRITVKVKDSHGNIGVYRQSF